MATLTWQDVAGRVAAPDFSDASALITQGIGQVSAAAKAPERLRQEQLDREMKGLLVQSEMNDRTGNMIDKIDTKQKNEVKERDLREFSKNQSYLESASRKAAIDGIPLPDFLAADPTYQSMGDGARAYGAGRLSDAYMRGDETRIHIKERNEDQAYRAQQDLIQRQQWNASFAEQRRNNAAMRQERAEAKAAADALKPKVWKTGDDRTDKAMTMLANTTGMQFIEASGAAYEGKTVEELGKRYKNLGAVNDVFDKVNAERQAQRLPTLPDNVLKRIVAKGVGANSTFDGLNDVDDTAIKNALLAAGKQFDTALKGRQYYEYLSARVDAGSRPNQQHIDLGWNQMFPGSQTQPPKNNQTRPSKNNRESAVPALEEIVRGTQMVYDPHLGREIPVGSYTTVNPRPADKPRKFKPSTRPRVTLTVGDVIKPPSY